MRLPPVAKRHYLTPVALGLVALAALSWVTPTVVAQEKMRKSEVVKISDTQDEFFKTIEQCRTAFDQVAQRSAAFQKAEETAQKLARDPQNTELKRQMVADRFEVVEEKMESLREATSIGPQLDSQYQRFKQQLDARILDAKQAVKQKHAEEEVEAKFLYESIDQLKQLEAFLPYLGEQASRNSPLSEVEKQKLRDFKNALEMAEVRMELAKDNANLQTRRAAILAEIRIKATKEYVAIRTAIAHARSDQAIFAGITRNDLTYLDVIEDELVYSEMLQRQPIEYQRQSGSSAFRGGYQFQNFQSPQPGNDPVPSSRSIIDRIDSKLKQRRSRAASDENLAVDSTERRN